VYTDEVSGAAQYPLLRYDGERDCFVVWVRWVSMEKPASPEDPPNQGIRVELKLNRNTVLGPTILYRRQLEESEVFLRANTPRVRELLRTLWNSDKTLKTVDLQLTIHGSIANAPYVALYHLRDYEGEAIDTEKIKATPLVQLQPSTPGDQWHVAGQANVRVELELSGAPVHLRVVR
jgi:hypothetical protein